MRRDQSANTSSVVEVINGLLSHLPPNPRLTMEIRIIVQEFDKMLRQCQSSGEVLQVRKVLVEFFKQYDIERNEK